jgi:hypothetical protein
MEQSSATTTDPPPSAVRVSPLTQTAQKGGDLYMRHADVEAEIAEALGTDPATWTPKTLKSETLVHLVRWVWPNNDGELIGKIIGELGRRLGRIVKDVASGLSESEAGELAADVAGKVNCLIFASVPSRQSEFLEVSFRSCVKRHSLKERAKVDERKAHVLAETSLGSAQSFGEDGGGIIASLADDEPSPEDLAMKAELERLNPERVQNVLAAIANPLHREAVILHFLKDWPIESNDPQLPTLSTHFGKSGRQIQNWIKTAKKEVRTALGDAI